MISLKSILVFLIFIFLVFILASLNNWFWAYPWLDMPLHFLGGFWVAMVYFWLLPKIKAAQMSALPEIIGCFAFIALIGVLVEFVEFLLDLFVFKGANFSLLKQGLYQQDVVDTMVDLFFNFVGGTALMLIFYLFKGRKAISQ